MARKKQNYWYVLVLTNEGPKFVTKVDYRSKQAEWNTKEKPLELGESSAKDLSFGLMVNFFTAYAVCTPVEMDSHPYFYDKGHFTWEWNKDKEEKKDDQNTNKESN